MEFDLTTVGGLSVFLTLIVSIAVKPLLENYYPKDEAGSRPNLYGILINAVTLGIALIIATLVGIATWTGVPSLLAAIQLAVLATASSIGLYEAFSNTRKLF